MTATVSAWQRNLAGCVAVAAAVAAFSVGLPAVDEAIPDSTVSHDSPLAFAAGVTVVPPPNATLDAEGTSPEQGVVTMSVDGVQYRLQAEAFDGTLQQLADRTRELIQGAGGVQAVSADRPASTVDGVPGLQASFVAEQQTGWYTVFLDRGTAVTAVIDGPDASVTSNRDALEASVRSVAFGQQA
ncbi:MAG TPA: hypothetical protein VI011_18650 [Asanoa sp.]